MEYKNHSNVHKFHPTSLPRVHAQGGKVIGRVVVVIVVVVVVSIKIAISRDIGV